MHFGAQAVALAGCGLRRACCTQFCGSCCNVSRHLARYRVGFCLSCVEFGSGGCVARRIAVVAAQRYAQGNAQFGFAGRIEGSALPANAYPHGHRVTPVGIRQRRFGLCSAHVCLRLAQRGVIGRRGGYQRVTAGQVGQCFVKCFIQWRGGRQTCQAAPLGLQAVELAVCQCQRGLGLLHRDLCLQCIHPRVLPRPDAAAHILGQCIRILQFALVQVALDLCRGSAGHDGAQLASQLEPGQCKLPLKAQPLC